MQIEIHSNRAVQTDQTRMQLAVLFGGFLSILLGTMAPFVILIVLKTVADVAVHLAVDLRDQPAAIATSTVAVP